MILKKKSCLHLRKDCYFLIDVYLKANSGKI